MCISAMVMLWGQFFDHDISLTAISKISEEPSGMFNLMYSALNNS